MSIQKNCLLINLSISLPPQTKISKPGNETLTQAYKTTRTKAVKKLFSRDDMLPLTKIANLARKYVNSKSLPFGDSGQRIIPANQYFDFMQGFAKINDDFDKHKRVFLDNYHLVLSRAFQALNGLWDESDYPTAAELETRISMGIYMSPVSASNDFDRVAGLTEEEKSRLKIEIEQAQAKDLEKAVGTLVKNLMTALEKAVRRLSDEDSIFRDSLIGNIHESVEAVRNLNITGSAELSALASKAEDVIVDVEPDELRQDMGARKAVVDSLAEFF